MLKGLLGNRNVVRILLFLFVNETCYGTQLQSLLQVPLTPIQRALARLERDHIICSRFEGKTRIYEFSSSYPLRAELELLLRKAYTLLPSQEKKIYCFIHRPRLSVQDEGQRERSRREELLALWDTLKTIQQLSFLVKSHQGEEQTVKVGKADVVVTAPSPQVLVFREKGFWYRGQTADTAFSNSFCWTLDLNRSIITLEHLRFGATQPVFLFHLAPTSPGMLESIDAHLCAEDTYLGNIVWEAKRIDFHWRIIGPLKNNQLTYQYS